MAAGTPHGLRTPLGALPLIPKKFTEGRSSLDSFVNSQWRTDLTFHFDFLDLAALTVLCLLLAIVRLISWR